MIWADLLSMRLAVLVRVRQDDTYGSPARKCRDRKPQKNSGVRQDGTSHPLQRLQAVFPQEQEEFGSGVHLLMVFLLVGNISGDARHL